MTYGIVQYAINLGEKKVIENLLFFFKFTEGNSVPMKKIVLIILLLISAIGYSQIDTLHYLPPLFGRTNVDQHYISISTLTANNVNVDIKRGDGTLIQSVVVTQATPSLVQLGTGSPSQGIIDENGLNTINTSDGIIVEATEPVFVNLRHVQSAQGMCLTSKGNFALGTNFRSGHLFNNTNMWSVKAHTISVMAIEDNTVVDFSDISPNVIFKNTAVTGTTSNAINVTLDAGESYTIAAYIDEPGATGNRNDVNGTHITSTKNIVVNSGSWLGGADGNGRDIGMDQIVPIEHAGVEYVVVEGDGNPVNETPCVVAEFNNTQIFLNGSGVAAATINAGDYYFIPNNDYAANGNMYIQTSEPAFVYQSLSGASHAACGLNFIPPIKCGGTRSVSIPNVNLVGIPYVSITARTGASVYVNGNPTPIVGAQAVTGNPFWVTYDVPGGTGNFFVTSDSVIKVALLTLDGVRGSAGYFSGFSDFQEIIYRDTFDYVVCQNSYNGFVKLNGVGPFLSNSATFFDPSLGGTFSINSISQDTLYFTYQNNSAGAVIDSVELETCKIFNCSGSLVDTTCDIYVLAFDKIAPINTGVGDSVGICADTSAVILFDLLLGSPPVGGTWVDDDQSGLLFNGTFQTSLAAPGVYHFTYLVNGQAPCYDSTIVTINVLPMSSSQCCGIAPTFVISNVDCNGVNSGSIQINDIYTTQFSIDSGQTFQNNGNFTGLSGGTYDIRLEFGPDCNYDTTIILTEPATPIAGTFVSDTVSCIGVCDGAITVSASGGIAPYIYTINGSAPQLNPVFSNLCAANQAVNIIDANNCVFSQNIVVEPPPALSVIVDSVLAETCGDSNGLIGVSGQGGSPNYQYSINNGPFQSSQIFNGLTAGTYTIEVRDTNNCVSQINSALVNEPGPIPFIDSINNIQCFAGTNGFAMIGVNSGTPNFTYSINNGVPQTSNTFNMLSVGTYNVLVEDANGCVDSVGFTLTQPTPLVLNLTQSNTTCFGDCDGEVYLDITGSNPPYQSSVGGGVFGANTFTQFDTLLNFCPQANINIVVKDSLECLSNAVITITEPDSIQIIPAIVNPTCYGFCDGLISFSTLGGTGNFEYSINNGLTFQPGNLFLNLCEDNYDLLVRDSSQCVNSDTISIVSPLDFNLGVQTVLNTLCGVSSGSITVDVTTINPNYTFTNLNTGTVIVDPSSATFGGLSAGTYSIEAVDISGCVDTIDVGISDNALTVGFSPAPVNVLCFGECTGSFTVTTVGGTPPYQYSINNGPLGNSPTFTGLCAQIYVILVQDAAGCIETIQLEITQPDEITFSTSVTDVDCNSQCTGLINFSNNSGGVTPYMFSVNGGTNYFTDSSFTNLCTGPYDLYIQDANNCQSQAQALVQITESTIINNISATVNLTCNNSTDGIILFSTNGGSPPYVYSIDDGVTFSANTVYNGLSAGTYFIEVQDILNCIFNDTLVITEPNPNAVNIVKTENTCPGLCEGEFVLNATGGTPPYLYSIDAGNSLQTSNTFDTLCSGNYQIQVLDDNNCQVGVFDTLITIPPLALGGITVNSNCDAPTGAINLNATGGTPAYTYSIDGTNYLPGNLFSNLGPGFYDVYVLDANSCADSNQLSVVNFASPEIDSINSIQPCFGVCNAQIQFFVSGGNGVYEYSLDGVNFQPAGLFNTVCPGNYTLTVRDGNGCVDFIPYTIIEPDTISITSQVNQILCFGDNSGLINISSMGGVGIHTYTLNGIPFGTISNFPQLSPGAYSTVITDEIGCTFQFDTVISEPTSLQIAFNNTSPGCFGDCDGTLEAIVIGGTVPYSYNWSSSITNSPIQNNICAGFYSVLVIDDNGCSIDSVNFELTQPVYAALDSVQIVGVDCWGSAIGSSVTMFTQPGNLLSFDGAPYGLNNLFLNQASGNYLIEVQDVNACDGDSIWVHIPTPQPLGGFPGPTTFVCPGDIVAFAAIAFGGTPPYQYSWNNGSNIQEVFSENIFNDTTYFIEITDDNGCVYLTDTMSVITTLPPTFLTSNDTMVCVDAVVTLVAVADGQVDNPSYSWSTGINDTNAVIMPTILGDSLFYVTVTDECNLTTVDSINVALFPDPTVQSLLDSVLGCIPFVQTFPLNVNSGQINGSIDWFSSLGTISSSSNSSITINYTSPGIDQLHAMYTSSNGCDFDIVFDTYIEMNVTPTANFSFNPENPGNYDSSIEFENESSDYDANLWTIDSKSYSTIDVDFLIDDIINIYKPITACLEVTTIDGCKDQYCRLIDITVDQLVFVPNSFTPADGANSIFKAEGQNIDPYNFHMTIFNRWGEIVFESYDIDHGWDGTYQNDIMELGVYVWKIDVGLLSDPDEVTHLLGHVTLLR